MKNAKFFETNGVQHLQPVKILSAISPLLNSVTAVQASLPEWYRRAWQVKLNSSTTAKYIILQPYAIYLMSYTLHQGSVADSS
jgi:hypothetical protein